MRTYFKYIPLDFNWTIYTPQYEFNWILKELNNIKYGFICQNKRILNLAYFECTSRDDKVAIIKTLNKYNFEEQSKAEAIAIMKICSLDKEFTIEGTSKDRTSIDIWWTKLTF